MIYLDNAATTLQKPAAVSQAMARAVKTMSSPGRGGHSATRMAEETAFACREEASALFGVENPENVIFTFNATHALNIAIFSVVRPGMHVLISGYEHNAVTRPLHAIPNISLTVLDTPPFQPEKMLEEFSKALHNKIDAVVCNHVSNVFGCIQPVGEMAALCAQREIPFILDASQSAGVLPVRMDDLGAAYIAMPGHKGLYGPQGTGLLLCGRETRPLLFGGTGSLSVQQEMPEDLPDRLEAGTHNMPGIAGLLEGLRFVRQKGTAAIADHERRLTMQACRLLQETEGVRVFWREGFAHQTGVLSFVVEGMDCQEVAQAMAGRGIALRAGLQCAPLAHKTVGTISTGTVRFSPSVFTTSAQVEQFAQELRAVLRKK